MSETNLTRRGFLFRAAWLGAAAVGSATILARCKSDGPTAACDISGLTEQQRTMRQTLAYTDVSTQAGKSCSNCQLYTAPTAEGQCGTCQLQLGQVASEGYCNSWAQRVTAEGTT